VLHILDAKLSSPSSALSIDANTQGALKQHRLNILIEAMKTYQPQYDGVDWVSETIRHIVNIAQLDTPHATSGRSGISDWTDILASQPTFYLRLALTMDLSLSKGRLPEDGDFPVSLQGLFRGGLSPFRMLLDQVHQNGVVHNSSEPGLAFQSGPLPNSVKSMQPGTVTLIASDEDTDSPESGKHSGLPDTGVMAEASMMVRRMSNSSAGDAELSDAPPSEGLEDLSTEVMNDFPLDCSPSAISDLDMMYLDDTVPDQFSQWTASAWDGRAEFGRWDDRDTANLLLEALKDTDFGECMA
jgi:hypothetical protein